MKKRAFTMIELVFVIVVVGILAAIMIPKLNRNASREAANQILTHIRYTQHLAMQDDKYSITEKGWAKQRWTIAFAKDKVDGCSVDKNNELTWKYSVYYDKSMTGNPNSQDEFASDIYKTGKLLTAGWSGMPGGDCKKINKELNIEKRFGIIDVTLSGGCVKGKANKKVAFDEMGRPMWTISTVGGGIKRPYDRLVKKDCSITITDKRGNQTTIIIEKESGFASIKENS